MSDRSVICAGECQYCGAPVAIRESSNGRAYYFCRGELAEKACGHRATFGPRPSEDLKKKHARKQNEDVQPGRSREDRGAAGGNPWDAFGL